MTKNIRYTDNGAVEGVFIVNAVNDKNYTVKADGKIYIIYIEEDLLPGDVLYITGRYRELKGDLNPYTFKLDTYYHRNGITGSIQVKEYTKKGRSGSLPVSILRYSHVIRDGILASFKRNFSGDVLGLIQGMFIGYKGELGEDAQTDFQKAGLSHIMAVSGANVAFILMPFKFLIFRMIKRRKNRILLLCVPTIFYLFVTGFGASILRATIMVFILFFTDYQNRRKESLDVLAWSAFIMLVISPFYIYDAGFLLSFSATGGIIIFNGRISSMGIMQKLPIQIRSVLAVSISAQLAVTPVILNLFNKLSVVSVAANVVFVPFTEIITILSLVSLLPVIAKVVIPILSEMVDLFLRGVRLFADISFSQVNFPSLSYITIAIYYLFVFELVLSEKKNRNYLNFLMAALCISILIFNFKSGFEIDYLSANNGDSILISTSEDRKILIDGGDNRISFGKYGLVPYLLKSGVLYLDMVFVTHSDSDHLDGIYDVIENISVNSLIMPYVVNSEKYSELAEKAAAKGIKVYYVQRYDKIRIDNETEMAILNPSGDEVYTSANNESIVILMGYSGFSFLFMGDAEMEAENSLSCLLGPVDVLKAGHHGSNTSSGDSFLSAAEPNVSVISAGTNTYGHPSPKAVARLSGYGDVYITKTDGHIKIIVKNDIIYIDKFAD